MKIVLTKLNDVTNCRQWFQQTVAVLTVEQSLKSKLLDQLTERESLGSVQIAEYVILPHVVNDELTESWLIISKLRQPVKYREASILTGIYIFSRPNDSLVDNAINQLTDESVIKALQKDDLDQKQVINLLGR